MSKRKLLLADDSVTIQKVVNLTFADEGIEVIAVGDGNSAMSAFAETNPDIVLADVNMPGLSGYEVCENIRRGPSRNSVPVILLVGSFEQFDQARAVEVGANAHITKPFQSIRQLVTMVTEFLAEASTPVAASAPQVLQPVPAVPNLGDELIDSYTPDTIRLPRIEPNNDDILAGSELDALLGGRPDSPSAAAAEDFNILDIPMAPVVPQQAVQPERPAPQAPVQTAPPVQFAPEPQNPFFQPPTQVTVPTPAPPPMQPPVQSQALPTTGELSPQAIEMVAERLAQKISEDTVREIANKIVPEVTAMIIKKMVEQASRR